MKMIHAMALRIDFFLKEKGMTQYQLSKEGGIPRKTINYIMTEKKNTVTVDTLFQICSTLGISIKTFFDDEIFEEVDD